MGASGVTKPEDIEKLLNHFCVTLSDLPLSYKGWDYAYPHDARKEAKEASYRWGASVNKVDHQADFICHQSAVIERLITALQVANNRIQGIRETAAYMAEKSADLWEDQRDAGFDEACMEIVKLIDSYSIWKGEEKSAE